MNEALRFRARRSLLIGGASAAAGAVLLAIGAVADPTQMLFAYLSAYAFCVTTAIGALLFSMTVHAMGATWPLVLRRLVDGIAASIPALAILFVPIALGLKTLYPWAQPHPAVDEQVARAIEHKHAYLNPVAFDARAAGYFVIWTVAALGLRHWSISGDRETSAARARAARTLSVVMLPLVGLSFTFASFDWFMSLTPAWYSTMYGVYTFGGGFLAALAAVTMITYGAERRGLLPGLRLSHYYALGRLLLSFTIFWAYIAFFQYFLIWIANKPEEVTWYLPRVHGAWGWISVALIVGHFAVPFLLLLPYRVKHEPRWLAAIAGWLLAFHWVDSLWLVAPAARSGRFPVQWVDGGALLFVAGVAVVFIAALLDRRPLLPLNDAALGRALAYESL